MISGKKALPLIALCAILIFHLGANFIWLRLDKTDLLYDAHHHYLFSLTVFDQMRSHILPSLSEVLERIGPHHRWHGIFPGYATAPFYFFFGVSQDAGVMASSLIFLTVLILATYGIGKTSLDQKSGVLSAFIVGMYPAVFNHSRLYMLDLPLTSMVALSIYLLLKSDDLRLKRYFLLFSVAAGLGLLCKFNFLIFVFGPFIYILIRALLVRAAGSKKRIAVNLLLALGIAALIIMPFLALKHNELKMRIYEFSRLNPAYSGGFSSWAEALKGWAASFTDYLLWAVPETVNTLTSFMFFLLLALALPFFLIKKCRFKAAIVLWAFAPFVILASCFLCQNINRYLMPSLPALAVVCGVAISSITNSAIRKATTVLIVFFGIWQYLVISFNLGFCVPDEKLTIPIRINRQWSAFTEPSLDIKLLNPRINPGYRNGAAAASYPDRHNLPYRPILERILASSSGMAVRPINLFFTDDIPEIYEPMEYLAFAGRLPLLFSINPRVFEPSRWSCQNVALSISGADYIIAAQNTVSADLPDRIKKNIAASRNYLDRYLDSFALLGSWPLGQDNRLLLYRRKEGYSEISSGRLRLYFRNGIIKLFSACGPVLINEGLEAWVYAGNNRYSSCLGNWSMHNISGDEIRAEVSWPDINTRQRWVLRLQKEKLLVNIKTSTARAPHPQGAGYSLYLNPKYVRFSTAGLKPRLLQKGVIADNVVALEQEELPLWFHAGRMDGFKFFSQAPVQKMTLAAQKEFVRINVYAWPVNSEMTKELAFYLWFGADNTK